jgi:hypothetical protein
MRVTYHERFSLIASLAVQFEGKKGQNGQTLGGRRSLERNNGESARLVSSCV